MMLHDDTEAAHPFSLQPTELAQARHPMPATANAAGRGLSPEFDRTILFPHLLMNLTEQGEEPTIGDYSRTHRAIPPGIVAAAANPQCRTEGCHAMGRCVSPDECVFQGDSLAKYAAAFFKNSRSSVTRANSRRSRASSAAGSACRPDSGNAPPCAATSFCHL